jgi:hypothetical protein
MDHQIQIKVIHSEKVMEDEAFETVYHLTNTGAETIEDETVTVIFGSVLLTSVQVTHPIPIQSLRSGRTMKSDVFRDTPLTPGKAIYLNPKQVHGSPTNRIFLFSETGGRLNEGQVISSLKVISNEESQQLTEIGLAKKAITFAQLAIVAGIILEFILWVLEYWYPKPSI